VVVVVTGAELCSVLCCACRGAKEGAGKEKRERKKEEGERREAGEKKEGGGGSCVSGIRGEVASVRRDARGERAASAGFAATVASEELSTRHVAGVEEKRKAGGQCRMSDGERSRDVLGGKGLGTIRA
jgi:hypothetical protein